MGLQFQAAQSGQGGITFGRNMGGGVGPGHMMDNAYYTPPDPAGYSRDMMGRPQFGLGMGDLHGPKAVRHPQFAQQPQANPMLTFLRQAMGMPTSNVGQRMAESLRIRQMGQMMGQMRPHPHGFQPPRGQGLDQINSLIGPQVGNRPGPLINNSFG